MPLTTASCTETTGQFVARCHGWSGASTPSASLSGKKSVHAGTLRSRRPTLTGRGTGCWEAGCFDPQLVCVSPARSRSSAVAQFRPPTAVACFCSTPPPDHVVCTAAWIRSSSACLLPDAGLVRWQEVAHQPPRHASFPHNARTTSCALLFHLRGPLGTALGGLYVSFGTVRGRS